jgi:hypothetical protein
VLGVESFAKTTVNHELETSFEGAKDVLNYLAIKSPQAAHYFEILTSLSSAITKRRSKAPPASGGGRYVSRIFSLDSSTTSEIQLPNSEAVAAIPPAQMGHWEDPFSTFAGGDAGVFNWSATQLERGDLDMDWEGLNISQWDNFPYS